MPRNHPVHVRRRSRRSALPYCHSLHAEPLEARRLLAGTVVINELHVDPDVKVEQVEFVELHNPGNAPFDLSGASFTSGITYTFPAGTILPAGGFLVVAAFPNQVQAKFGISGVLGPFSGKLSNEGENVVLTGVNGVVLDEVEYDVGFPWPTVGDAPGYSMELINPLFDNNLGGNWRSHLPTPETTLIPSRSQWRYRKGTSEASNPISAWRQRTFVENSTWLTGTAPIGYDPTLAMGTNLSDMHGGYTSVFMRKTFNVANPNAFGALRMEALFDDGFKVWINGQLALVQNVPGSELAYNAAATVAGENANYQIFTLNPAQLQAGENIIAVQFFNASIAGSSDAYFDARLIASPKAGGPSPGAANVALSANVGPQTRQVTHSPMQPTSGQDVIVTAKITDPQGVTSVTLDYQLVNPGAYIRLTDAGYQTNWTTLTMHDDGLGADATAGDGIYSVTIPAAQQVNRRLVRYRISATDGLGMVTRAPYLDDPQPNFAYFVYDGIPAWTGANQPGATEPQTFGTDITANGPATYHLIAAAVDVANSQYNSAFNDQLFSGTFVYEGVVYDHIQFRNRGEYSTYESGKNKWRINFNRGHALAAKDNYGRPYKEKIEKLNLNGNASPWLPVNRGMAGLDEAVAYRLYQLAGVLAPNTHYVHLRVIDEPLEASPASQYIGDLWGLYLAVEHTNGEFVDEHEIPDGNIYEIEYGPGSLRNQSPDQPTDGSDWNSFRNIAMNTSAPLSFWQNNVNLGTFYSFTAINRVISNVDLLDDSNYLMYHAPDGLWQPMPWDLDMIYVPETHRSGKTYLSNSLVYPSIQLELRNRSREIMDLMFADPSRTGGQIGQLVEEFARMVNPSDGAGGFGAGWAELDQFLWNYHPRTTSPHRGAFYKTPMNEVMWGGAYTRTLPSADFDGMVRWIIDFMTDTDPDGWAIGDGDQRGYGFNYLEYEAADPNIPNRPTVSYTGPANYPIGNLQFTTSAYSDPNGSAFAGMQWRIGEISNPNTPAFDPNAPWKYEMETVWQSGIIGSFDPTIAIPASAVQVGHTYRVRVRMLDNTGRWSRWSDVTIGNGTEFTVTSASTPLSGLRVTELNYNPSPYPGYDTQDFEYIELMNISDEVLDLQGVSFDGIDFVFGDVSLEPGQVGVVARNVTAFQARYGTSALILGAYGATGTNFANGGEQITIRDPNNQILIDFTYDDGWYPSTDGGGRSMEVVDPHNATDLSIAASWRASAVVGGTPGIVDVVAPSVLPSPAFDYAAPQPAITFHFDEPIWAQSPVSLLVQSAGGATVAFVGQSIDASSITFTLPAGLADGRYTATLSAGSVLDLAGNALEAAYPFSFFILRGDANHDAIVDINDLSILIANWQGTNKTFAQADFNYDGRVDASDLAILASNWQKTPDGTVVSSAPLPAIAGITPAALPPTPPRRSVRDVFRPINLVE